MKREKVRRQIRRAAAAALLLAAAFSLPAGTEIMGVRLGNAIVASASDSGDFGENLHWEFDDTGKLTISYIGTGDGEAMPGWVNSNSSPWSGYRRDIKSIVIQEGVTSIGSYSFSRFSILESVTIPKSVTVIGTGAFYESKLNQITFAEDSMLETIGSDAFNDCTNLTSITIPDGVTSIGSEAFCNCYSLTSIAIPDDVTSIGNYAFSLCSSLKSIFLPEGLAVSSAGIPAAAAQVKYTVVDDGVFLIKDVNLNSQTSVNFPDTIGGKTVTAVFIEDGTTGVNVPTSATQIKYTIDAEGNVTIKKATLGEGQTAVAIPEQIDGKAVTAIGDGAFFGGCTSLVSINIPNGVTSIGEDAFIACPNLGSITIPSSVTSIGTGALNCFSSITVDESNPNYSSKDGVLFNKDGTILIAYPINKSVDSYIIPDGVKSIEDSAFVACESLTSITIPGSVTSIGVEAFYGCRSLESVFLPEGLDVSYASITASAAKVRYIVDADGNATIVDIDLGTNQTEVDIPEKIGEYPVISAAEEYQQYVGEHTHTGGTASCTEMGVCSICGQEYVGALGHDYGAPVFNWAEDNSCKAVFTCETDSTHVAEEDCEVSITASTDAVCETGGSVTYTAKVTFEGREYTDEKTVTVPAKGHNIVKVEKTEPTCTEDGYEAHYKCSVCGKLFSDSEGRNEISAEDIVIPAKGHDFEDGVCTVCGETDPDYSEPVEPEPEPEPTPDPEPVVVYYPVVISGNVAVDKPSAAAGDIVNVSTDFGYDVIVTDANGRRIAKIDWKGSFTMPDSKVYITVVRNETLGFMSNAWSHSYVYSYDSDMNRIKVNSDSKRGVIVIDLGSEYAGRDFTVYSGRKSTKTVIISSTLDENGRFTFEAPEGKNYTLVVE